MNKETQIAIELYNKLPSRELYGMRNAGFGIHINNLITRGNHGDYMKEEYGNFILYIVNNFEKILELEND